MAKTDCAKDPKFFFGYWIVLVAFLCLFIHSGCGLYAFSLFVRPLQADLAWSRGEIMAAFTIYNLVMGVISPVIGRVVDRYGVRGVISIGSLVAGLGFVLLSLMHNLWSFYVGYAVIGGGMSAMGLVPATAVVSNWFRKHRGTAIGIVSTGIGGGGFVVAPLVGAYVIPNFGWRASYFALGLLMWMLIPPALLVIRTKPSDMGLYPDGVEYPEVKVLSQVSPAPEGVDLKMALATSGFWLITVCYVATAAFCQHGVIQSQVPYMEDIGFPVTIAATALGAVGLGSAIGKFGFGWLCDQIPPKYACSIGFALQGAGVAILMTIGPTSPLAVLWLYAITFGLGVGSWLPTMSMLISTNFGLAAYGAIFGVIAFGLYIGVAAGPLVAAYIHDTMNSYQWAFIIFLALYVIAIPTIFMVRRPKGSRI